tara:strand:+ start:577 stop:1458 length:882 start_codon:yes stop_codon:yes gene_type:complete
LALRGGGGERGLLDIYGQDIVPSLAQTEAGAARYARASDVADVTALGQSATEALLASDPEKRAVSDELMRQARAELEAGATLDPSLRREAQQAYRNAATARGMAYNPNSAAEEAYFTGLQAEQLRRQRQAFAMQALGQRQGMTGDPFMAILGRPSQSFSASQGFGQQGFATTQTSPGLFSPESQYAGDVYASNQQTLLGARQATAANRAAVQSGIFQGLGALGGGWASCWVAREVYGAENPKWLEFFHWKEFEGPAWFRATYNRFGEGVARFIKDKPRIKNAIRNWMDARIGR